MVNLHIKSVDKTKLSCRTNSQPSFNSPCCNSQRQFYFYPGRNIGLSAWRHQSSHLHILHIFQTYLRSYWRYLQTVNGVEFWRQTPKNQSKEHKFDHSSTVRSSPRTLLLVLLKVILFTFCASTGQRYLVLSCSRARSYVFPGSAILYCLSTRVLDLPIKLLAWWQRPAEFTS